MFLTKREAPASGRFPKPGFLSLRQEMDRLFEDWASEIAPLEMGGGFEPRINVVETAKHLRVTAELPGLEEKDVEVELDGDYLRLRGKKEEETSEKGDNWYRAERRFGSFERTIPLPWRVEGADAKVDAVFKKGVLTVTVDKPKEARAKSRKVDVKVG